MRDEENRSAAASRIGARPTDERSGNALCVVALFTAAVLVNGILAILGIEALQALGVWPTPEAPPDAP